jgi:superfamily II DNA or RNA helicase
VADIVADKINEVYVRVTGEPAVEKELHEHFKYQMPNFKFTPAGRKGKWQGWIHLYNARTHELPAGLLRYLFEFARDRKYTIKYNPNLFVYNNFSVLEAAEYIKSLNIHSGGKPLAARDYQEVALAKAVRYKKLTMISPTSSGKSYIIYCFMRWLLDNGQNLGLLTVPTTALVEQMHSDFKDYSTANKWPVEQLVQRMYDGYSVAIEPQSKLVVSTWQSIYEFPEANWFDRYDFIVGDEAHTFAADCVSNVAKRTTKAAYRLATTGTSHEQVVNNLKMEGWFGPVTKITTTKKLMDAGHVSKLFIKSLVLKYPPGTRELIKPAVEESGASKFAAEMEFIISNEKRNKFIRNLALSIKGNTLVLFHYVDKHGRVLHEMFQEKLGADTTRKLFYVHGGTEVEDREEVRRITETEKDAIIVASFGVFSTGTNIKNLHNLIFASPTKAKIRTLQSIGRILRLAEDKSFATLYDIADDFREGSNDRPNFTLKHYAKRMIMYYEEKFEISHYTIQIKQ